MDIDTMDSIEDILTKVNTPQSVSFQELKHRMIVGVYIIDMCVHMV